jgi:hypothetical protein
MNSLLEYVSRNWDFSHDFLRLAPSTFLRELERGRGQKVLLPLSMGYAFDLPAIFRIGTEVSHRSTSHLSLGFLHNIFNLCPIFQPCTIFT